MLNWIFRRTSHDRNAHDLYGSIVTIYRHPSLYSHLNVADTLEMRFELLMLHMFAILRWLNGFGDETGKLRQSLVDSFFADIETTSRQVGVGDFSVPKKMRKLAAVFAHRMEAYNIAADQKKNRNLRELLNQVFYSGEKKSSRDATKLVRYLERLLDRLNLTQLDDVIANPSILENLVDPERV